MPEINKISHGLTIGDLKFGNARPGVVEATLKPGETMEEALDELDERLNAWHRKRYPHLYQPETTSPAYIGSIPAESKKEAKQQRIGVMAEDILSCQDLKVLDTYRVLSTLDLSLSEAYAQRLKELTP